MKNNEDNKCSESSDTTISNNSIAQAPINSVSNLKSMFESKIVRLYTYQ